MPNNIHMLMHPSFAGSALTPQLGGDLTKPKECIWDRESLTIDGNKGIIDISGGLYHEKCLSSWYESLGFFGTYDRIRRDIESALSDDRIEEIYLNIDSPGGMVSGCFSLVDFIFASRGIKPIIAVLNEEAYSAAYAIASACDKIVMPSTGGAGSIGVITVHVDNTKRLEASGIKLTPITAGDNKDYFSSYGELTPEVEQRMQADIDKIYDLFVKSVARNRNISEEKIRETQALIYSGTDAVDVGLVDEIADVYSYIKNPSPHSHKTSKTGSTNMATKTNPFMSLLGLGAKPAAEAQAQFEEAKTALETKHSEELANLKADIEKTHESALTTAKAEATAQAQTAHLESAKEIVALCATAGRADMAGALIAEGKTAEEAQVAIADNNANHDDNTQVASMVQNNATKQATISPIIAKLNAERK